MAFAVVWFRRKSKNGTTNSRCYDLATRAIREAMKGVSLTRGRKQSESHKRKRLESLKGNKNGIGHVVSEEHKKSISAARKEFFKDPEKVKAAVEKRRQTMLRKKLERESGISV